MKVGAVGLGSRISHVYLEFTKINPDFSLVAFVDPQPIGKKFAEEKNFFPKQEYPLPIKTQVLKFSPCIPSNPGRFLYIPDAITMRPTEPD